MELIVEVLGMVDGAMEKAGRERHYFQASQLQADAKRLRHILRTSENVCKDFKCSIYQGALLTCSFQQKIQCAACVLLLKNMFIRHAHARARVCQVSGKK